MIIIVAALMPAAGSGWPSPNPNPTRVCDVAGYVSATVYDSNINRIVSDQNIVMSTLANTCHVKTIFDFPMTVNAGYQGALFSEGVTQFTIKLVDGAGGVVAQKHFEVKTTAGQIQKSFQEPVLFKNIEAGKTYTIKMESSFSGAVPQTHQETITVN